MIEFPVLGAKGAIAFFGLFHTGVAAMSIGIAFVVTIAQIVGYRTGIRIYDQFAKRAQLFHVCIYNVGTINAIGLVFALSGLFPQFWEQLFTHFFWALMVEEFLFLLLATTLTFHYFFWDKLWGHKKLHIMIGALMTPLFLLQMYMINALGGFMMAPGIEDEGVLTQFEGVLGYATEVMYNPSFLMLQLHRTFANVSYAGFGLAGWCGLQLFLTNNPIRKDYYQKSARLSFYVAFAAFLALPVIGYFYSWVLKYHAEGAFWNLMLGAGDVVKGSIDLWWLKHYFVAGMMGMAIYFYQRQDKGARPFSIPAIMVYAVAIFYLMFYIAMGMVMTWTFFWVMLVTAVVAAGLAWVLMKINKESGRAVFMVMGIAAFCTIMLGGWSREAARPRFVNRISHYDSIYAPSERQVNQFVEDGSEGSGTGDAGAGAEEGINMGSGVSPGETADAAAGDAPADAAGGAFDESDTDFEVPIQATADRSAAPTISARPGGYYGYRASLREEKTGESDPVTAAILAGVYGAPGDWLWTLSERNER